PLLIPTAVARDGMVTGPATDRLAQVLAVTSRPVIASGGVATLDDLRALAALEPDGRAGATPGKALCAGRCHAPGGPPGRRRPPGRPARPGRPGAGRPGGPHRRQGPVRRPLHRHRRPG